MLQVTNGAIRQQFSTPANIEMSIFGAAFLKNVGGYLATDGDVPDVPIRENGFLFLAGEAGVPVLEQNHRIQAELGAENAVLSADELHARFPWLNVDGIAAGSLGLNNEGWFDPWALLQGFRKKAISLGAEYRADTVVGLRREAGRRLVDPPPRRSLAAPQRPQPQRPPENGGPAGEHLRGHQQRRACAFR